MPPLFTVLPPSRSVFNLPQMKLPLLLSALASSLLLAGCHTPNTTATATATPPPPDMPAPDMPAPNMPAPVMPAPPMAIVNLGGEWSWTCCDGHYHGDLKLQQDGNKLTGRLFDDGDTNGGAVEGTVTGNQVHLARSWGEDFHQDYTLTLSADGNKLAGELDGTRDESVGAHFEATRK